MSSLADPRIAATLERLHDEASRDPARWEERRKQQALAPEAAGPDPLIRLDGIYMAFAKEEGEFLYFLARSHRAMNIVEFGASYGVSTTYLGAAVKDMGGRLVTTEVHPNKCQVLRNNLADAGLDDVVDLLEGDARETLATVQGPIDMLVLDGWKGMYLPVLEIVRDKLHPGSLIVADNISHEAAKPYLDRVTASVGAFLTHIHGELALTTCAS